MTGERSSRLQGCRALVVEDVYLVADDVRRALTEEGAIVIGPVGTLEEALERVKMEPLDLALIDVNLNGDMSYPLAEELERLSVPFVFATGYDDWALPERWQNTLRVTKPYEMKTVVDLLGRLLG